MKKNDPILPKQVLGLYCLNCLTDMEIDHLGNFRCYRCFSKIGVLKVGK